MVKAALTLSSGEGATAARLRGEMDFPYIHGRPAFQDASELIERFGEEAVLVAAGRARDSRRAGNVLRFCHWRQIERVIAALDCGEPLGRVH